MRPVAHGTSDAKGPAIMTATLSPDSTLEPVSDITPVAPAASTAKRPRALQVMGALLLAAAVGGGAWYAHGVGRETTDDAQVEGHIMNVSARLSGHVARVLVQDNQIVDEGTLLVQLDDADLKAKA